MYRNGYKIESFLWIIISRKPNCFSSMYFRIIFHFYISWSRRGAPCGYPVLCAMLFVFGQFHVSDVPRFGCSTFSGNHKGCPYIFPNKIVFIAHSTFLGKHKALPLYFTQNVFISPLYVFISHRRGGLYEYPWVMVFIETLWKNK